MSHFLAGTTSVGLEGDTSALEDRQRKSPECRPTSQSSTECEVPARQ